MFQIASSLKPNWPGMIIGRSSVFYVDRKSKMAATTGHIINTGPYRENTEISTSLKLLHWLNLNYASIIGRSFTNFHQQWYPEFQRWFQANDIINTRIHTSVTLQFYLKNGFNKNEYFFQFYLWRYSVKTQGVDVNNAWPLTCKASCLKKIELRPLISGFDFALLEVRNLCVASRLIHFHLQQRFHFIFLPF